MDDEGRRYGRQALLFAQKHDRRGGGAAREKEEGSKHRPQNAMQITAFAENLNPPGRPARARLHSVPLL